MRMPRDAHKMRPWRVHSLASDFQLLDVWRYPVEIENAIPLSCFTAFMRTQQDEMVNGPGAAGMLFRLREKMGQYFGWDEEEEEDSAEPGTRSDRQRSLRHRLTEEDHEAMAETIGNHRDFMGPGFQPVYIFEEEFLLEIQNATVHALIHLGRVPIDALYWSPQMAVYVVTRGHLGSSYMALITPFRHGLVYPAMMRAAEKGWPEFRARFERTRDTATEHRV